MRGIERERIEVEGLGESVPIAINSFSDGSDAVLGRYLNRHVIVSIKGSLPADTPLCGVFVPENLKPVDARDESAISKEYHFTIQLMATSSPVQASHFEDIPHLKEYACKDGYYRYTTSSFRTFPEARRRLLRLLKSGYPDAFIQTREWYDRALK